jgi:hypothetical protein
MVLANAASLVRLPQMSARPAARRHLGPGTRIAGRGSPPVEDLGPLGSRYHRFDARYVGYSVSVKLPALTSHCRKAVTAGASLLVSGA